MSTQTVLESDGVSIWKMAVTLPKSDVINAAGTKGDHEANGYVSKFNDLDESEDSEGDEDSDSPGTLKESVMECPHVAIGYDDGCVRIYVVYDSDEFIYVKSLPRVNGEIFLLSRFVWLAASVISVVFDLLILIKRMFLGLFSGRVLSVAWSEDAKYIYSGSSDGYVLMS